MNKLSHILLQHNTGTKSEQGFSLIESLVAVAVFGVVAVTFLIGLSVSSKALMVSQERVTAESLSKSQMEYIKNCAYDKTNNPPVYDIAPGLTVPEEYSISLAAERLDPQGDGLDDDDGLQKITITVNRNADALLTTVGYKFNR